MQTHSLMSFRFALVIAMATIVASGDQTEHVKCSHRCSFNGRRIISCVGEVSNADIVPCYTKYKQATVLDLALSEIQHVSRDLFRDLIRIRHLYLDFVEAERVDKDSFSEMKRLESISLRGVGPERLDMFIAAVMKGDKFLAINIDGNYKNCSSRLLSIMDQLTADNILIEYSRFTPRCGNGKQGRLGDHLLKPRPASGHTVSQNTPDYSDTLGGTVQDTHKRADSIQAVASVYNQTDNVSVPSPDVLWMHNKPSIAATAESSIIVSIIMSVAGWGLLFIVIIAVVYYIKKRSHEIPTHFKNVNYERVLRMLVLRNKDRLLPEQKPSHTSGPSFVEENTKRKWPHKKHNGPKQVTKPREDRVFDLISKSISQKLLHEYADEKTPQIRQRPTHLIGSPINAVKLSLSEATESCDDNDLKPCDDNDSAQPSPAQIILLAGKSRQSI